MDGFEELERARLAGACIVASNDMHNWHIVGDMNTKPAYTCPAEKYAVLCDPQRFSQEPQE